MDYYDDITIIKWTRDCEGAQSPCYLEGWDKLDCEFKAIPRNLEGPYLKKRYHSLIFIEYTLYTNFLLP